MISAEHILNDAGHKLSLDTLLGGENGGSRWQPALSNRWGRLAQGNDAGVAGTNTIKFVPYRDVQKDNKVTYASFVCDHRPLKDEIKRISLVVGGDKLEFYSDSSPPATGLTETKLLLNCITSNANKGANFASMDLKDMFLHNVMEEPEYMKVNYKYFTHEIRKIYNLDELVHSNDYVYINIQEGMYGLKQAAILVYNEVSTLLKKAGYQTIMDSLGMWKYHTRRKLLCLGVDDFGIKYYDKDDIQHLENALKPQYTATNRLGRKKPSRVYI